MNIEQIRDFVDKIERKEGINYMEAMLIIQFEILDLLKDIKEGVDKAYR
jgi:hypothetical protein